MYDCFKIRKYSFFTVVSNVKLSVFVHDENAERNLGQIKFLILERVPTYIMMYHDTL